MSCRELVPSRSMRHRLFDPEWGKPHCGVSHIPEATWNDEALKRRTSLENVLSPPLDDAEGFCTKKLLGPSESFRGTDSTQFVGFRA